MKRAVLLLLAVAAWPVGAAETTKPNVIIFLADDLGARDLGCYGSTFYDTPHLDRMAKDGMKFTNAYAACPVCSPTRAALLTGRWPQRTGVTDYIGAAQPGKWQRPTKLRPAPYAEQLALEETTLAEALKAAGYATMHAGKWHLGGQQFYPEQQGYDVNMGGLDKGGPYGGKKYFSPYDNPRLPDGPAGEHIADRLAAECGKFIEASKDRPFFVSYCLYDVHTPLMGKPELVKKYAERARWPTSNAPLRGGKGWLYEGGVREPLIVRWPGKVAAGSVSERLVSTPDIFGTVIEACGLAPVKTAQDSVSLLPTLRGAAQPARSPVFWHYPHYGNQGGFPGGAMRDGDWKLLENYETGALELYNLAADPSEKSNRAADEPARVKTMHAQLTNWRTEVGAKMPTPAQR